MAKRPNPFGDVPPIQLKTHVNSKHVATKEELQEVYRNTRARLFKGAREAFSKEEHQHANGVASCLPGSVPNSSTFPGQREQGRRTGGSCRCCRRKVEGRGFVCSYCKHTLCGCDCLRECCVCGHSYCQLCTVLNYDHVDVRTFCMDCLTTLYQHS